MRFQDFAGNADVKKALVGMVDSGRIPHAILFHENDGGGAMRIVLAFLQYLYCRGRDAGDSCAACPSCNKIGKLIHPDVHFIFPVSGKNVLSVTLISKWRELVRENPDFTEAELNESLGIETKSSLIAVAEAKALLENLALSALEGGYRSVVIYLPEKMNAEAANRLLKVIEEPPEMTQFLLITHSPEKVLQTISSRCQSIRIMPGGQRTVSSEADLELFSELMESVLSGDLLRLLETGEKISALPSRENAKAFCKYASARLRDIFLVQQGMTALLDSGSETGRKALEWAASLRKNFPRKALDLFDNACRMIERNVNVKIVFTDLCDGLYLITK